MTENPFHRPLIELSFERGLRRLTVEELCERAGLERSAFEARYVDLEDCFCAIYEECAERFLACLETAYEGQESWRQGLRAVAYATMLHLREDPARAHFTVVEALGAGERAQLVRERVFATLVAYVDRGRFEPGAPASLTQATAESLNGAVFRSMRVGIEEDRSERPEEVLPELMHTIVLTYLGPEAAAEELEIGPPEIAASVAVRS